MKAIQKSSENTNTKTKTMTKTKVSFISIVKQILSLQSDKYTFLYSSYPIGFISNQPFCDLFLKMKPGHIRGIAYFVLHRNHCVYSF